MHKIYKTISDGIPQKTSINSVLRYTSLIVLQFESTYLKVAAFRFYKARNLFHTFQIFFYIHHRYLTSCSIHSHIHLLDNYLCPIEINLHSCNFDNSHPRTVAHPYLCSHSCPRSRILPLCRIGNNLYQKMMVYISRN